MGTQKVSRRDRVQAKQDARKLLESTRFLNNLLVAIRKQGLVGEERNALVLFVVVVSRILQRPLNAFVKGHSSAGKNWLVTRVLSLVLRSAVAEITSVSEKAWNYSGSDFQHRVVYIQEQNEAAGTIEPMRLLISEGQIVRLVTTFENGTRVTKRYTVRGPVAAISTTTKNRLQIDDETRHVSIWVDESPEQTRRIAKSYTQESDRLSRRERKAWQMVHGLLADKIGTTVIFPSWFEEIADQLFVDNLSVRRYYPAFVEACRAVCLIRSFQPSKQPSRSGKLEVDFADFAITAIILDPVFVESLHIGKGAGEATRCAIEEITDVSGEAATAKELARKLKISIDKAYAKLRYAESAGLVQLATKPTKCNRKRYHAWPKPRFVPDPEKFFRKLGLRKTVRFIHPITGKSVVYKAKK